MKKSGKIKSLTAVCAALLLCMPILVYAFQGGPQRTPPPLGPPPLLMLISELDLTAAQQESLAAVHESARTSLEAITEEMKSLGLFDVMLADDIDEDAVQSKIEEQIDLGSQMAGITLNADLEAVKILTVEQRAELLEKLQNPPSPPSGTDNGTEETIREKLSRMFKR